MKKINTIIFDLDGTLIDSSDGVVEAVNYSLEQMGEPLQSPDKIKPFIGFPLSVMYPYFSDKPVKELYAHFQTRAAETVVASTVILPGVEPVLQQLFASGYTLTIASTKIRIHITGVIDKFGWDKYFKAYSGGDEVANVKPAPDIFSLTLEKIKAEKENSIVVGDTINDIHAAQALPLPVIAIHSPYGNKEEVIRSKPDFIIDTIEQLVPLLRGNSNG